MKYNELSAKWKNKLAEYLGHAPRQASDKPSALDFKYHLHMQFADDSYAMFYYAFYIIDQEADEVAIFTEHCGYHIFPFSATKLHLLSLECSDIGITD